MEQNRAAVVAGYRLLADLLEKHPELPIPYHGPASGTELRIYMLGSDRAAFVDAVRALPGRLDKSVAADTYVVRAELEGIAVEVVAYRKDVCERVVTGTREVTKSIPDPDVEVPTVEVTEVVEDVEWVCSPLLAEQAVS